MIPRGTVLRLGLSQLICWGISHYLIGVFGEAIVADLGWSRTRVYGGFSLALLVMGLASPAVGRAIDRLGGGRVMAAGSLLCALGCAGLALARSEAAYYAAWLCLGLAMRAILYDAAFAALARLGGAGAGRAIAQITLLGGLASTCFWPLGHFLAESLGWRGALLVYAGVALLTLPLHLSLPAGRCPPQAEAPAAGQGRERRAAALLFALIVTLVNGLNAGLTAHMIGLLSELGLAAGLAVSLSALRGIGQSAARLAAVLAAGRLDPVALNLVAALVLPLCFALALAAGVSPLAAAGFAFFYGAGNGILTITRGTLPLALFGAQTYGAFVGRLLVPGFLVSAAAPLAFAAVIESFGARAALALAIALSLTVFAAALALKSLAVRQAG